MVYLVAFHTRYLIQLVGVRIAYEKTNTLLWLLMMCTHLSMIRCNHLYTWMCKNMHRSRCYRTYNRTNVCLCLAQFFPFTSTTSNCVQLCIPFLCSFTDIQTTFTLLHKIKQQIKKQSSVRSRHQNNSSKQTTEQRNQTLTSKQ